MRSLSFLCFFILVGACGDDDSSTDTGPLALDAGADVSGADVGADSGSDAAFNDAGGSSDAGNSDDAGGSDAGSDAGADAGMDATIPPPAFADFPIGPYASALTILVDSLLSNAASLDTSARYGESAAQGYLLQGIGELLWASRDASLYSRDALIVAALGEIDELERSADRTTGAAPAFGLTDAWDAFGDGSVNPAYTAYTWQSGMVALGVAKIARVLVDAGHPEAARVRDFGVALVQRWDTHFTRVSDGAYWWYSTTSGDAIAVHNTSALIAMASQLLGEAGGPASLLDGPRDAVDLLWARMRGNPSIGYEWNYADDGFPESRRRPEDVSHALVTLQLMAFAREREWWSATQAAGVSVTLLETMWTGHPARLNGFVDGSTTSAANEYRWSAAAGIGYAAHGRTAGGNPETFDAACSILFSTYLSPFERPLVGGRVDAARSLLLALLASRRPDAFANGTRWRMVAGATEDDAVPSELPESGGVRFYTVDWSAPSELSAGLTLPARRATSASANFLVDLAEPSGRVIVSLVYRSGEAGAVQQWDGSSYRTLANLPASTDRDGAVRWMRTTFELNATRFDYQSGVVGTNVLLQFSSDAVALHSIEATPL